MITSPWLVLWWKRRPVRSESVLIPYHVLRVRGRSVGGSDQPLNTAPVRMRQGESLLCKIPLDHVLLSTLTVSLVSSVVKIGQGIVVPVGSLQDAGRAVGVVLRVTNDAGRTHLIGVVLTLSNGDTWVVNVPVEVAQEAT